MTNSIIRQPGLTGRTLYNGENLDLMRQMDSNSVHLIATDPPFCKGRDFHATPESLCDGAKFQDRWSWDRDVHDEWKQQIHDDWKALWSVIEMAKSCHSKSMAAYICWLSVRVLEMHRILREDGSLYLHCDQTASAYIRQMLDSVFGYKNFRNEIVWSYGLGGSSRKYWSRKHDNIFFYTKSDVWHFDKPQVPATSARMKGQMKGMDAVWHIPTINNMAKERVDYPTQKPLLLYRRKIEASTQKGDVVFDPFAGCATTLIAAEQAGRQWIGADLWENAHVPILLRYYREQLGPNSVEAKMSHEKLIEYMQLDTQAHVWFDKFGINFTKDLPIRTDGGACAAPYLKPLMRGKIKDAETEDASAKWSNEQKKAYLIEETRKQLGHPTGIICWGCGREFDHPDYLHLDHIRPRTDGGANSVHNRALLCYPCNGTKRKGADLTLTGLRKKNRKDKFMKAEIGLPVIGRIDK